MRLNGTLSSPQTDTYHHKFFIDTVLNNDRDDGETILKPEGWFNGLTIRDQTQNALKANELNLIHDYYKALPEDEQACVLARKKFLDGVILRFKPYLEVFNLSKLLVPGVQVQIQMYLNSHEIWSQTNAGARQVRDITADDLKVTLFLRQKEVEPTVYRGLMTQFTGS